ncbi:hypothetical protein PG995_014801 [Apiospora arundinis]
MGPRVVGGGWRRIWTQVAAMYSQHLDGEEARVQHVLLECAGPRRRYRRGVSNLVATFWQPPGNLYYPGPFLVVVIVLAANGSICRRSPRRGPGENALPRVCNFYYIILFITRDDGIGPPCSIPRNRYRVHQEGV